MVEERPPGAGEGPDDIPPLAGPSFQPYGVSSAPQAPPPGPARAGWPPPAPDPYAAAHIPTSASARPPAQDWTWLRPAAGAPASAVVERSRRGRGTVGLLAATAVTALVVGGGAGYAGARLAADPPSVPPYLVPTPLDPAPGSPARVAPPLPPAPGTANTVEIAKRVLPGTVMIKVGDGIGSGFVFDRQGRIVTNNHVVAGAAGGGGIRVVFFDGRQAAGTLVGRSPSYDLAVIQVRAAAGLRPVAIANSDQTQVGQPVVAVGSPLGLPGTVTQGIVSARNRPVVVNDSGNADAPTAYINAIQTDAPINPGNSGGPLVDAAARVIGVNSAILTMSSSRTQSGNIGLGFAIPINQAATVAQQLITQGKATYPVIGASVEDRSGGAQLTAVDGAGPAQRAGLREGDVVTSIDATTVGTAQELIVAIRTHRPGASVRLDYTRGSAHRQAEVTLGSKVG